MMQEKLYDISFVARDLRSAGPSGSDQFKFVLAPT